jgi:large subunit ribosomal protein L23
MSKQILVQPLISEKTELLSTKSGQYTFIVMKKANKVEIRKAVEKEYNVVVSAVNTAIMPAKIRQRNTKAGLIRGRIGAYKKAIVTLAKGEAIDYYGEV